MGVDVGGSAVGVAVGGSAVGVGVGVGGAGVSVGANARLGAAASATLGVGEGVGKGVWVGASVGGGSWVGASGDEAVASVAAGSISASATAWAVTGRVTVTAFVGVLTVVGATTTSAAGVSCARATRTAWSLAEGSTMTTTCVGVGVSIGTVLSAKLEAVSSTFPPRLFKRSSAAANFCWVAT